MIAVLLVSFVYASTKMNLSDFQSNYENIIIGIINIAV